MASYRSGTRESIDRLTKMEHSVEEPLHLAS